MKFVDIELDSLVVRAQLLEERSPNATKALWDALPFEGQVVHSQYSGAIFRMLEHSPFAAAEPDRAAPYQHPGLLFVEPGSKEIGICYGQGRLVSPVRFTQPIPLAEIGGDLSEVASFGISLQFEGAKAIRFRKSEDQESPLEPAPKPVGRTVEVTLGNATATATLLEEVTPTTAKAFADLVSLTGRASNTYSGGPLVRFWNDAGGPEGETPLDMSDDEPSQSILYPGYIYYLPLRPWRGLRMPTAATSLSAARKGASPRMVPLAKFDGDWSSIREEADRILVEGAKPMSFRIVE